MTTVAVLFVICAIALILIILIQKGKGGGLGAALGGGAASGILGSKTGDFLTWVTIVLVGLFLTLAVAMAKFYKPTVRNFDARQTQQSPGQQKLPENEELPSSDAATDRESIDVNSPEN